MPMKTKVLLLILAIVIFIPYSNTFTSPFQWDDYSYIVNNLRSKDSGELLRDINGSRFIGFATFYLNFLIAGLKTPVYHLTNLLIHIGSALLVFFLLRLLLRLNLGDAYREYEDWIAFFGALLFGLHPVNTMAVTYISQRFGLLCTFFYLLSLYLYLVARPSGKRVLYALSLLSCILSMKSKENSFTIPFVVLLFEFLYFKGKRPWPVLLLFLMTLLIIPLSRIDALWDIPQQSLMTKTAVAPDIPRHLYLFTQFRVLITYMRLLILPYGLNIDYDYPLSLSLFETDTFFSFLVHLTLIISSVILIKRKGHARLAGTGIIWYYLTLSVESSIFPIPELIMEYRLYLPFFGFVLVLTGLVLWFIPLKRYSKVLSISVSLLLLFAGILTFQRNSLWASERSLWEDALRKSPQKIRTRLNYANTLPPEEAVKEYEEVLKRDPYNRFALNALADSLIKLGRYKEAEEALRRSGSVAIEDANLRAKAELCIKERDYNCALAYLEEFIRRQPGSSKAYFLLGLVYEETGRIEDAEKAYRESLRLDPGNVDSLNNLGNLVAMRGRLRESLELLERARSLRPDLPSIYINIGVTYAQMGDYENALWNLDRALRLEPRSPDAWFNKGLLLLQAGMREEGLIAIKKALEIDPDYRRAREVLDREKGAGGRE
jgi:tetratricopeptide (TPR) repeat protein